MKNSVRTQIKILFYKNSRRIFNSKNLVLTILLFIVINIYLTPVKDFSIITGYGVNPWIYPFLISDANFLAIFVAGVIYYFSNVPFMQRINSYYLLREGRKRWIIEQFVYIVSSAFTIVIVSVLLSILVMIPYIIIEKGWGKVLFTLARTDAGSMVKMLFISLYINKSASVLVATGLVIYSSVVANIGNTFEKKFAVLSPISWLRVTRIDCVEYGFSVSPSLYYILIGFSILIIIMVLLINKKCMKIDFVWENEDE